MAPLPRPLAFFLLLFSGWVNRHQQAVTDYSLEENRVLRAVIEAEVTDVADNDVIENDDAEDRRP